MSCGTRLEPSLALAHFNIHCTVLIYLTSHVNSDFHPCSHHVVPTGRIVYLIGVMFNFTYNFILFSFIFFVSYLVK